MPHVSHTQPSAPACVDLPELDAFLQARGGHGALAGVRLSVAGADKLAGGARLRQADQEGTTGESLDPTERAQAVFTVFARICGDTGSRATVTGQLES